MGQTIITQARFNLVYSEQLTAINAGLALQFDQQGVFKTINALSLAAVDLTSGGFQTGVDDPLYIEWKIVKGIIKTFLATSPPIPSPWPLNNEIEGDYIAQGYWSPSQHPPVINFTEPLSFDSSSIMSVMIKAGYDGQTGVRKNAGILVSVLGQYTPIRNANLTKQQYLNPNLK